MSDSKNNRDRDQAATLQNLLASAEQLRDGATRENHEFIAYLADMTVMEIKREIERQSPSAKN